MTKWKPYCNVLALLLDGYRLRVGFDLWLDIKDLWLDKAIGPKYTKEVLGIKNRMKNHVMIRPSIRLKIKFQKIKRYFCW